ncbi:MAG: hypothetical protein KJ571_02260 [Bacteroidetes bacterium]|nr:hypothetical protein [Bacteroidota bacterium]
MKKLIFKYSIALMLFYFSVIFIGQIIFPKQQQLKNLGSLYFITPPENQFENFDKSIFKNLLFEYSYKIIYDDSAIVLTSTGDLIKDLEYAHLTGMWSIKHIHMKQPVYQNIKLLRSEIETRLKGKERIFALNNIIPVISLNDFDLIKDFNQLKDDIAYISDNYGGVGFLVDRKSIKKIISKIN